MRALLARICLATAMILVSASAWSNLFWEEVGFGWPNGYESETSSVRLAYAEGVLDLYLLVERGDVDLSAIRACLLNDSQAKQSAYILSVLARREISSRPKETHVEFSIASAMLERLSEDCRSGELRKFIDEIAF